MHNLVFGVFSVDKKMTSCDIFSPLTMRLAPLVKTLFDRLVDAIGLVIILIKAVVGQEGDELCEARHDE